MEKPKIALKAAQLFKELRDEAMRSVISERIRKENHLSVKEIIIEPDKVSEEMICFVAFILNGKEFKESFIFDRKKVRDNKANFPAPFHATDEEYFIMSVLRLASEAIAPILLEAYKKQLRNE